MRHLRVHVGCGNQRLAGFVNIDVRLTQAVDVTADSSRLNLFENNVELLFSNGFFEHLFRLDRARHLTGAYRALCPQGVLCYLAIPNFPVVARSYLDKGPGTSGPVFTLYNAFRYTHADYDQAPGSFAEEAHKCLFDKDELETLLRDAGFEDFTIFQYAHPDDSNPVPVNLGLYAVKRGRGADPRAACRDFLSGLPTFVLSHTIEFLFTETGVLSSAVEGVRISQDPRDSSIQKDT